MEAMGRVYVKGRSWMRMIGSSKRIGFMLTVRVNGR
jgi:hypothetical protein